MHDLTCMQAVPISTTGLELEVQVAVHDILQLQPITPIGGYVTFHLPWHICSTLEIPSPRHYFVAQIQFPYKLPTTVSIVARTGDGKTSILYHMLTTCLITPQEFVELHHGEPMPGHLLEAFLHVRCEDRSYKKIHLSIKPSIHGFTIQDGQSCLDHSCSTRVLIKVTAYSKAQRLVGYRVKDLHIEELSSSGGLASITSQNDSDKVYVAAGVDDGRSLF